MHKLLAEHIYSPGLITTNSRWLFVVALVVVLTALPVAEAQAQVKSPEILPAFPAGQPLGQIYIYCSNNCGEGQSIYLRIGENNNHPAPYNGDTNLNSPLYSATYDPQLQRWSVFVNATIPISTFRSNLKLYAAVHSGTSPTFVPIGVVGVAPEPGNPELFLYLPQPVSMLAKESFTISTNDQSETVECIGILDGEYIGFSCTVPTSEWFNAADIVWANVSSFATDCGAYDCSHLRVAYIYPQIEESFETVQASTTSVVISGSGFASSNPPTVYINGALNSNPTVTGYTANEITITFSTPFIQAGNLTVAVSVNSVCWPLLCDPTDDTAVVVAQVVPSITPATSDIGALSTVITINGAGFGDGASAVTNVNVTNDIQCSSTPGTGSSSTRFMCTVTQHATISGDVYARIYVGSFVSELTKIGYIQPEIESSSAIVDIHDFTSLSFTGAGFGTIDSVSLSLKNGICGSPTVSPEGNKQKVQCSTFTKPTEAGDLLVSITNENEDTTGFVKVRTVRPWVGTPMNFTGPVSEYIIEGEGFDSSTAPVVTLDSFTQCTVTSWNATHLICHVDSQPRNGGHLVGHVTVNSVASVDTPIVTIIPYITSPEIMEAYDIGTIHEITIRGIGLFSPDSTWTITPSAISCQPSTPSTAVNGQWEYKCNILGTAVASLMAKVTFSNGLSTGDVQIGYIRPKINSGSAQISALSSTITITGAGFASPIDAVLGFETTCSLTVINDTAIVCDVQNYPTNSGALQATVTVNGITSQQQNIAIVIPAIVENPTQIDITAYETITIKGAGFGTNPSVNLNLQAACPLPNVIRDGSMQLLTCGSATLPSQAGYLSASVTASGYTSPTTTIQGIRPVIEDTSSLVYPANAAGITITGKGFASPMTVTLTEDFQALCSANVVNSTMATCLFDSFPLRSGVLSATATVNQIASFEKAVATIAPAVITTKLVIPVGPSTPDTFTIAGYGFGSGASVSITSPPDTSCTAQSPTQSRPQTMACTFQSKPSEIGPLKIQVSSNSVASIEYQIGSAVAAIDDIATLPVILANADTLSFRVHGIKNVLPEEINVELSGAGGSCTTKSVTQCSGTQCTLTCQFTVKPPKSGILQASVNIENQNTESKPVCIVRPFIETNTIRLPIDTISVVLTGNGLANVDRVDATLGMECTIISAQAQTVTCQVDKEPTMPGPLSVVVTADSQVSDQTQIATMFPVITQNTEQKNANVTEITISGKGFVPSSSPTPSIVLTNGATCTLITVNSNSAICRFNQFPESAGALQAVITYNNVPSEQTTIATIKPVIIPSTRTQPFIPEITELTITGYALVPEPSVIIDSLGATCEVNSSNSTHIICSISGIQRAGVMRGKVRAASVTSDQDVLLYVAPVLDAYTALTPANTPAITINGAGFDTTTATTVHLSSGNCASVTVQSTTSVVCATPNPALSGPLYASVTVDTVTSIEQTQIATIHPVVSSSSSSALLTPWSNFSPTFIQIDGYGLANINQVSLNLSATCDPEPAIDGRSLRCDFEQYPAYAGDLEAVVTASTSQTSGAPVKVHEFRPYVANNANTQPGNKAVFTISGYGFVPQVDDIDIVTTGAECATINLPSGNLGELQDVSCDLVATPIYPGVYEAKVRVNGKTSNQAPVVTVTPVLTPDDATYYMEKAINITLRGYALASRSLAPNSIMVSFNVTGNTQLYCQFNTTKADTSTGTSLTCLTTAPQGAGTLQAAVRVDGYMSNYVVVGKIAPTITVTAPPNYAVSAPELEIPVSGFTAGSPVSVSLSSGACTVSRVDTLGLRCNFTAKPSVGPLNAIVTINDVPSDSVTVANIVPDPIVQQSTANFAVNNPSLTIRGSDFGTIEEDVSVQLSSGACDIAFINDTMIVCSIKDRPVIGSNPALTATITKARATFSPVQVATLVPTPVVFPRVNGLLAGSTNVTIYGASFGNIQEEVEVIITQPQPNPTFTTTCSSYWVQDDNIVCVFAEIPSIGPIYAEVIRAGGRSEKPEIVGTLAYPPIVYPDNTTISNLAFTLTIYGQNFYSANASLNEVLLNNGGCKPQQAATTSTQIVCELTGLPLAEGDLEVVSIYSNGIRGSSKVVIRRVLAIPVIFENTKGILPDIEEGQTIEITGYGFSSIQPSDNEVILSYQCSNGTNDIPNEDKDVGSAPSCTPISATKTSIVCQWQEAAKFSKLGPLCARVNVRGLDSILRTQVATIRQRPTIESSNGKVAHDAEEITIRGKWFSEYNPTDNVVILSSGNCTMKSSTSTQLVCQPSGLVLGSLTAKVVVDGIEMETDEPVKIAEVQLRPSVRPTTRSLHRNSVSIDIYGEGFVPGSTSIVLWQQSHTPTCKSPLTVLNSTHLRCEFEIQPVEGTLYVRSITADTLVNNYAQDVPVGTLRETPKITNTLVMITQRPPPTLTIRGNFFSPNIADNEVILSSGTCTVIAATTNTIECLYNPFEIPAGELRAKVIVQEGVESEMVPIYQFQPYMEPQNRLIPVDIHELIIPGYWFTSDLELIGGVVFQDEHSETSCTVTGGSPTSVSCTLDSHFKVLGDVVAQVTIGGLSIVAKIGTVVPALYDSDQVFYADAPISGTKIWLVGAGLTLGAINWTLDLPENSLYTTVSCPLDNGVATNYSALSCTFSTTSSVLTAGYIYGAVSIDGYQSHPAVVATILPVVSTPPSPIIITNEGQLITITGYGFGSQTDDVSVKLYPSGACVVRSVSNTQITCQLVPGSLIDKSNISLQVTVRGVSTPLPIMYGYVSLPAPGFVPMPDDPPETNTTTPDEPVYAPEDISVEIPEARSVNNDLDGGAVAGVVIAVILGLLIAAGLVWFFVLRKVYPKLDFLNRRKDEMTPLTSSTRSTFLPQRKGAVLPPKESNKPDAPPKDEAAPPQEPASPPDGEAPPPPPPNDEESAPPPNDEESAPPPPEDEEGQDAAPEGNEQDAPPEENKQDAPPPPDSEAEAEGEADTAPEPEEDDNAEQPAESNDDKQQAQEDNQYQPPEGQAENDQPQAPADNTNEVDNKQVDIEQPTDFSGFNNDRASVRVANPEQLFTFDT